MKICLLSDLHYGNEAAPLDEGGSPFLREQHEEFAAMAHSERPDVLVVAGDVAETNWDINLLGECLDLYKNPHGASLMVPGNHDVWCRHTNMGPEDKYDWNLEEAERHGWVGLRDEPWTDGSTWIVGNMGWYDFSAAPKELGMTPERYEREKGWSDYGYMGYMGDEHRRPMLDFCKLRMAELDESLSKVPKDRKKLVIVTHIVGFNELLGPKRDYCTAFFGNTSIGKRILKYRPDLAFCGHTHSRAEMRINGIRCINNGSGYGYPSKRMDVVNL